MELSVRVPGSRRALNAVRFKRPLPASSVDGVESRLPDGHSGIAV
jgi:hypothetical protein